MLSSSLSSCCTTSSSVPHHPLHPLRSRLCRWCHVPCAVHLCLLEVEFQLCWCAPCIGMHPGAGQPGRPSLKQAGPGERNVVPGGPWQYYAVQPYSGVRRVWGRGGVGGFLIFRGPTPPHNLTAVILPTPVHAVGVRSHWSPKESRSRLSVSAMALRIVRCILTKWVSCGSESRRSVLHCKLTRD